MAAWFPFIGEPLDPPFSHACPKFIMQSSKRAHDCITIGIALQYEPAGWIDDDPTMPVNSRSVLEEIGSLMDLQKEKQEEE